MSNDSGSKIETMPEFIKGAIEKGIAEMIEYEFEEEKKRVIERIERKKAEVIAGIIVEIMSQTDITILQDRFIFTIRKPQ